MKIAVIDLGTNTCNLLVAEINNQNYSILHQGKELVRLGDDKIKTNEISDAALKRTLSAFHKHQKTIRKFNADTTVAIATSAVRSAQNKIEFLEKLGEQTGVQINVISGEKEAELIFKGVLLAFRNIEFSSLILDIGGGSNETILTSNNEIKWKESRPVGMSRIINQYQLSDPILPEEINWLKNIFLNEHKNAIHQCLANKVTTLIGCSGAFDTVADIIDQVSPGEKNRKTQKITMGEFNSVYNQIINSTREERMNMKGMDYVRVDLIVPAAILIETLISASGIKNIIQTDYALREGIIYEILFDKIDI